MSWIDVTYRVRGAAGEIRAIANALALEQSVEVPVEVVRDAFVAEHIVGRVGTIRDVGDGTHLVSIRLAVATTGGDVAQTINMLFGNSSLHDHVELIDADFPPEFLARFPGPRFGIDGLRALLDAPRRPLTCAALKPQGLPPERLAALCHTLALAGVDVIKDDHGLADHDFCPFEQRVELCQRAVAKANAETGGRTIYAPNLIGSPATVHRQFAFAREAGVGAVLLAPMLVGPALLHELASLAALPIIAHPAFGGSEWIAPEVLFGDVFKWFGADASIYPHLGGRFSYSRETCLSLAARLNSSARGLKPAFPVPAGGIKTSRVREVLSFYGVNTMLLVGGSLLESGEVIQRTKDFVAEVASVSRELAS
jgi:ribulose-bisphosphate carboxylase large chain